MIDKLKQLIHDSEGLTVEFKNSKNLLTNDIFSTIVPINSKQKALSNALAPIKAAIGK